LRDLDLTTLRLFVSVCETGNIARAGERASIVGSAISKRLAQLEDQVGTPLLVRKRHGVVPTRPARRCWSTRAACSTARRASSATCRTTPAAPRPGAHPGFGVGDDRVAGRRRRRLPAQPAHRSIQVDLEERVSPEIVRGVREGLASLGVCWDAADVGTLQWRPYRSDRLCVVVPAGHPLARRRSCASSRRWTTST
jgi:DNA-binding transcriptional LysR family regulator